MHADRSAFLFLTLTLFLRPHPLGWLSDMFELCSVLDDEPPSEVKTSISFRFNTVNGNWGIVQFHRQGWGWKRILLIKWLQNLSRIDFASLPAWSCRFQWFHKSAVKAVAAFEVHKLIWVVILVHFCSSSPVLPKWRCGHGIVFLWLCNPKFSVQRFIYRLRDTFTLHVYFAWIISYPIPAISQWIEAIIYVV